MTRMPAVSTMHAVPKGTPLALAINGGSSSIKFALYNVSGELTRGLHGKIDRIGQPDATIVFQESECEQQESRTIGGLDHSQAATFLIRWLSERIDFASVTAVGTAW